MPRKPKPKERELKPLKDFDIDEQLDTLPDWSAYGGVWRKFKGGTGTKMPDCTAENPCLREGWYSFGGDGQQAVHEYVSYTVSGNSKVIVQGMDNPFHARLIAAAPDLLRFVRDIAAGEALALSVVDDAKALLDDVRKGVHVPGRHEYTEGPYDPDEYETYGWGN